MNVCVLVCLFVCQVRQWLTVTCSVDCWHLMTLLAVIMSVMARSSRPVREEYCVSGWWLTSIAAAAVPLHCTDLVCHILLFCTISTVDSNTDVVVRCLYISHTVHWLFVLHIVQPSCRILTNIHNICPFSILKFDAHNNIAWLTDWLTLWSQVRSLACCIQNHAKLNRLTKVTKPPFYSLTSNRLSRPTIQHTTVITGPMYWMCVCNT